MAGPPAGLALAAVLALGAAAAMAIGYAQWSRPAPASPAAGAGPVIRPEAASPTAGAGQVIRPEAASPAAGAGQVIRPAPASALRGSGTLRALAESPAPPFLAREPPPPVRIRLYGGADDDRIRTLLALPDGGLLATGESTSAGGDAEGNRGSTDAWAMRLGPDGEVLFVSVHRH